MEELRDGLPACFFLSASCPKSSPGSYLWQLLPITGSRWPNRACLVLCWCPFPYPGPKTSHRATQSRILFLLQKRVYPSPFRGRGWVSTFLGSPGLPCSFKTDSHWPNRAGIEPRWCPLPSSQNRAQGHTGASLYLLPFSPSLSRREVTVNYSSTRMSLDRRKYSPQWRFLL